MRSFDLLVSDEDEGTGFEVVVADCVGVGVLEMLDGFEAGFDNLVVYKVEVLFSESEL